LPDTVAPVLDLAALDDVDDELPPQAVASTHAAASDVTHAKRFIGTLFIEKPLLPVSRAEPKIRSITGSFWEIPKQKEYIGLRLLVQPSTR
jgi:hypothetical protein